MTPKRALRALTILLAACLVAGSSAAPLIAQEAEQVDYGYGFYRTVEGQALLTGLDEEAEPLEVEHNYPVLTGDRLWVTEGARLEAVLPDKSVLRVGEGSELFFESLAGSADAAEGATTSIRLFEGEIQFTADEYALTDEPALFASANCRVYLHLPGTYRLISHASGWTEVVVREGFAEVNTEQGSVVARTGESVEIDGTDRPHLSVLAAGRLDDLEIWGEELGADRLLYDDYVDESLAYAAAPLERSGNWVQVSGGSAWRPTVRVGWRPFTDGWWAYTPSGLSWVAYEPWGWVTSHYGAWDYVPGYGWLWFPGSTYSPAWVYWYWGPTHTAWIPSGYYTRFYGPRYGSGFRFGVYGWAGGYWDNWGHWTFCPTRHFGRRGYRSYWRSGHDMHRDRRLHAVPRGVITTDTRDVTPRRWGKPTEIVEALDRRRRSGSGSSAGLDDVTSFVERKAVLADKTRRLIGSEPRRVAGSGISVSPGRRATSSARGSATAPWTIAKPEVSGRGRTSAETSGVSVRRSPRSSSQDWELVERLRRFENKSQAVPRSPRTSRGTDGGKSLRPVAPRSETPTRRILDGMRDRGPMTVRPQSPASSHERPTVGTKSEGRPPVAGRDRSSIGSRSPQKRPTASSGSQSSGARRGTVRSTSPRSGSRSSDKAAKPSGSSAGRKSGAVSRSKAHKRGS